MLGFVWFAGCDSAVDTKRDPAAPEVSTEVETTPATPRWYPDGDSDGYGVEAGAVDAETAPAGFVGVAGDCDDANPAISPGDVELCEPLGVDEDCDGLFEDEDDDPAGATWWPDADGDGLGDPTSPVVACSEPPGVVDNSDDCDDGEALGFDWADGHDGDCDGVVDRHSIATDQRWNLGENLLAGDAIVDDIDLDGCADLLVAVHAGTGTTPGGVAALHGARAVASGELFDLADWVIDGNTSMLRAGWDADGNGVTDLLVADWSQTDAYDAWWLDAAQPGDAPLADVAWARYGQTSWLGPTGDFDGDGALDVTLFAPGIDALLLFDAQVTGGDPQPWAEVPTAFGLAYGSGDLDGDGADELIYDTDDGLVVLFGSPDLRDPTAPRQIVRVGPAGGNAVAVGDFDGDGVNELVHSRFRDYDGLLVAYPGDLLRAGIVQQVWELQQSDFLVPLTVGDFDGDGLDDLAAASTTWSGGDEVKILRGGGLAPVMGLFDFDLVTDSPSPEAMVGELAAGDLDGDGADELIVGYHGAFGATGHYAVLPGLAPTACAP